MDYPGLRQSASTGKLSTIDVSQLDKINAIPNKITDNVLMDGLCQEDRLYLNALMDEDSNESEDDDHTNPSRRMSSAWSPMAQSPMTMMSGSSSKRMRRMKPSYAITLSLEDISYIRPSWGMSKSIKKIDPKKTKRKANPQKNVKDNPSEANASKKKEFVSENDENKSHEKSKWKKLQSKFNPYHAFLMTVVILLVVLMALSYFIDLQKHKRLIAENKIKLDRSTRSIEIYRPKDERLLDDDVLSMNQVKLRVLRMAVGQGIPSNLKSNDCTCEQFAQIVDNVNGMKNNITDSITNSSCLACLDWSMRANLRIYVSREQESLETHRALSSLDDRRGPNFFCYDFRWQSYDTLKTPLVDCFRLNNDEQWFGIGDIRTPLWPINQFNFSQIPITTNLGAEFEISSDSKQMDRSNSTYKLLDFGSEANFTFFTSSGFFLGGLRTDYQPVIWISNSTHQSNSRELCLSVKCTERCGQIWSRGDHLNEWQKSNNLLEYRVCSGANWRDLVSRFIKSKSLHLAGGFLQRTSKIRAGPLINSSSINDLKNVSGDPEHVKGQNESEATIATPTRRQQSITEGIGLIDRTIFATSKEFIPTLDGQTLRQFVDSIVKMGLKTSPILLIDARWQTFSGSLKMNIALFPKAKLLFEILHNKGLKIVLTVKPYIESDLGGNVLQHLAEYNRLYKTTPHSSVSSYGESANFNSNEDKPTDSIKANITRRLGFFLFRNETILIRTNRTRRIPYLFPTQDSSTNYNTLLDVTVEDNRKWMTRLIKSSTWITQEADGIHLAGAHPSSLIWDDHYREGLSQLVDDLFYKENLFVLPQWTGNFGYMRLAPRHRDWDGLQSTLESVLNLGSIGYALIHPGSVWGDLKGAGPGNTVLDEQELVIRWLQLSIFLPILQFKDMSPIDKYELHEQVQNLVKIRKIHVVPEIKKNLPFTPLVGDAGFRQVQAKDIVNGNYQRQVYPAVRRVSQSFVDSGSETIIGQQFLIGPDILVAPILAENQRQRDIYLPSGFWRDELKQTNIRGSKWLRNYPVELNEIAWFTRAKRR